MTSEEYVTYNKQGTPNRTFDIIERSIELQKWIIDPDSRPYKDSSILAGTQELRAHSAASSTNSISNAQIYREIRDKILNT